MAENFTYNNKRKETIHRLLEEVFSGQELSDFCKENFPEVADQFTAEMSSSQKIQLLIETCAEQGRLKNLLDQIEQTKPDEYQNFVQKVQGDKQQPPDKPRRKPRHPRAPRTKSEITDTKRDLLLSEALSGRYRIDEVLDKTGLGAVFKAYDTKLQVDVAIKVIDLNRANQPALPERVQQEVRMAIQLDHPGIVKIYDFGRVNSLLYIIMEFIPGNNLDQARLSFKHIALPQLLELCQQICLTVDYLHRNGVVHPGTKPENILLKPSKSDQGQTWHPVLINLGLLRPNKEVIRSGNVSVRRLVYMVSPEILLGHNTDIRSDVYTLGLILYDILVGQPPFWPPDIEEAINLHVEAPVPPPRSVNPNLPEPVEKVLLKALAKDPADRFISAKGLAQALADCIDESSLPSGPPKQQVSALPLTSLIVTMDTSSKEVAPGETTKFRIKLFNDGTQEDHRQIRVDGIPPEWVTISPSTTVLTPKEKEEVEIIIQPPLSIQSRAGRRAISIQVVNQQDPDQVEEIQTAITITPFYQFESSLWPQELQDEQLTHIKIENQGNSAETFTIQPKQEQGLNFKPDREQLNLEPGESGTVEFKVAPRRRYFVGDTVTRTFTFDITSPTQPTATHSGQVTSKGSLPLRWALVSILALMLCALAGIIFYLQAPALMELQASLTNAEQAAALGAANVQATREQAATATAIMATSAWLTQDSDRDNLTNAEEINQYNTDPNSYDTDGDTLPDGAEVNELGTDPLRPDSDFDGVPDAVEVQNLWDPESRDTDLDGTPDAFDETPDQVPTPTPEGGATPGATLSRLTVGFSSRQTFLNRVLFGSRYWVSDDQDRAIIQVSLDSPADRQVQVEYHIESSNAIEGEDYRFSPGTLIFLPGDQTKSFEAEILENSATYEKIIVFDLRNPTEQLSIGNGRLELAILNN